MKKKLILGLLTAFLAAASAAAKPGNSGAEYVPDEIIVKFGAETSQLLQSQLANEVSADRLKLPDSLKKLSGKCKIRKVSPLFRNFKKNRQRLQQMLKKEKRLLTNQERRILTRLNRCGKRLPVPDLDRIYRIKVELPAGGSLRGLVAEYNNDPDIEYAELNYIIHTDLIPNDPEFPVQWGMSKIEAPAAWDIHTGASEIIVAVIDTGVDYNHGDINENMWINSAELGGTAGVDDDGNGYIDDIYGYDIVNKDPDPNDDYGHGTHCAGTIAGEGNNALDISGLCWKGRIMALKAFDSSGTGTHADAIEAFYYAVENGADITSNSWGGGGYSQAMVEAINYARSRGVITVASAGNSGTTQPQYPAFYENVISVAATNIADERAWFSTYGDWVDIAAPGVDILSLQYGGGTAFASGTSMACPYVAGVCGLILSIYPDIDIELLEAFLLFSTDPIDPEICASGRLNAYHALLMLVNPRGVVLLDREIYNCSSTMLVRLMDSDLAGQAGGEVTAETTGGDFETVELAREPNSSGGIFAGTIEFGTGMPVTEDGILQVGHEQVITVSYYDSNDGSGQAVTVTETATVDCEPPAITGILTGYPGRQPRIHIETDEPTTVRVLYGQSCGGGYSVAAGELIPSESHCVKLSGMTAETEYFYIVEAEDAAGNITVDDNFGSCYSFTTTSSDDDVYVPAQCGSIQEGIDNCWPHKTVWVADGTWRGEENRDLDFEGIAITCRSENGPENCIIDCNGTDSNEHRGFYFNSGEDSNSSIDGFTIVNGYAKTGGAIYCGQSSPTISNCIFKANQSSAVWNYSSSPVLTNCTFTGNCSGYTYNSAGAMVNTGQSSPIINNCIFTENISYADAGAIRNEMNSNTILTGCIFSLNSAYLRGGAIFNYDSYIALKQCTISDNSSSPVGGAGMYSYIGRANISNSVIEGNRGGGIVCVDYSELVITSSLISNNIAVYGAGVSISNSRCTIINCTIVGNKAEQTGGGLYDYAGVMVIYNSIVRDNRALMGNEIGLYSYAICVVSYSNIKGGSDEIFSGPGNWLIWETGNIDTEPLFVNPGLWDPNETPADANDDFWVEGDYHLLEGSACINAGDPQYPAVPGETDLDGRARVLLGRIDMGAYEFNHIPVAIAGTDKTVYAWIDNKAQVTLDGGGSFDDDGDELSYYWSWTIDGAGYEATGVNATIELAAGIHTIKLIVSDGMDYSEPSYVVYTVIEPLEGSLWIFPGAINRSAARSKIFAYLLLPGVEKDQIDTDKAIALYPGVIDPAGRYIFQQKRRNTVATIIVAHFDKKDITDAIEENGPVELKLAGQLKSGQYFYGSRVVRILDKQWRRHKIR